MNIQVHIWLVMINILCELVFHSQISNYCPSHDGIVLYSQTLSHTWSVLHIYIKYYKQES